MASVSSIELLPQELIENIIAHLVEDPSGIRSREEDTLADVKNCALVSTGFGTLCQPYLFRTISHVGFYQLGEKRLMRLVRTLMENPRLMHHVREIIVGFSESGETRGRLTRADIAQASSTLLQLSNIRSLTILDWSYTFSGRIKLPKRVYTLLHQMIDTNLSRGTLRSLHVVGLKDLQVPSLLTHPTLRGLHLGRIPLPSFAFSCPHITDLDIHNIDSFDVSILSQFSHLERLSLSIRSFVNTSFQQCGTPPFLLRKLNLDLSLPHMIHVLVDFYSAHARSSGVRPFENLYELNYAVPYDDQPECLQHILNQANSLKVLEITTEDSESGEIVPVTDSRSFLERIQLSTKLLKTFPNLTNLRISLYLTVYPQSYDSALSHAVSLLDSISHKNAIEEFVFVLVAQFVGLELPPSEPWSQMGQLLSNTAGFPMLRRVEMSLFLHTDDETLGTLLDISPDVYDQLDRLMIEANTVLLGRGTEFQSMVYLTER